jgi:L-lactate dehydrogenase complex protein LldG
MSREAMLERIRDAVAKCPVPRPDGGRVSAPDTAGDVELFAERVADYRATVTRADAAGADRAVAERLAHHGAERVVNVLAGDAVPSVAELDALDGVVTGCALAIAETGTIALVSGPECGPRRLTLVPDLHVCVVRADQVMDDVPSAMAALRGAAGEGLPITLVSGPSATSDIELERVEGVHGPRRLEVVLVT